MDDEIYRKDGEEMTDFLLGIIGFNIGWGIYLLCRSIDRLTDAIRERDKE